MIKIEVVSVGRSDYGIYLPLLRLLQADPEIDLQIVVAGMHLAPIFGLTYQDIERDGYQIVDKVEMTLASDSPEGVTKSIGLGVIGFGQCYARNRPDLLIVLGDRFEMFAAVLASLPFGIPVAHIHGGELTFGAMDDSLRHSITKLSHLHFASTQEYAQRIIQMGEAPWRVFNVGALAVDNINNTELLQPKEFQEKFRFDLNQAFLLVTFHPTTLEQDDTENQTIQLLTALEEWSGAVLITMPNADPGSGKIRQLISAHVSIHSSWCAVENLGSQGYFSAMKWASAMVGNSSSGLIEAGYFDLPVVNIGSRQKGRIRGPNIVDVKCHKQDILEGINKAVSIPFREHMKGSSTPYGLGMAAIQILNILKAIPIDRKLLQKEFYDFKLPK